MSSISSKDFQDKESRAWLDTGDSKDGSSRENFKTFSPEINPEY